jgi:cytochrome c oxidase subunit 4
MTDPANAASTPESPADGQNHVHVVPVPVLVGVFAALIVLTGLTVLTAEPRFDFGGWHLAIALGIAAVKASLVALYYMHLRYDHPFHGLIFVTALVFLALFLTLTMVDTLQYGPDVRNWPESTP